MSITIKRLDFVETINAMLCCTARHAVTADGARQRALDEIAVSLNNVAAIIARHKLADQLNGPIPPVPSRDQPDGDGPDAEELEEDEVEDASLVKMAAEPDLNVSERQIYRFISTNPGCTLQMVVDHCGMKSTSVSTYISSMRRRGVTIAATRTKPTKYRVGGS